MSNSTDTSADPAGSYQTEATSSWEGSCNVSGVANRRGSHAADRLPDASLTSMSRTFPLAPNCSVGESSRRFRLPLCGTLLMNDRSFAKFTKSFSASRGIFNALHQPKRHSLSFKVRVAVSVSDSYSRILYTQAMPTSLVCKKATTMSSFL